MSWLGVISPPIEPGFSLLSPEKTPLLSRKQQMLLVQQDRDRASDVTAVRYSQSAPGTYSALIWPSLLISSIFAYLSSIHPLAITAYPM